MRSENIILIVTKTLLFDTIRDIIRFPFWWYSKGLVRVGSAVVEDIKNAERSLGVLIWMKNIFTPMYGQYDFGGRIISVLIRVVQIIVRTILLFFWVAFILIRLIIWAVLPIIIASQLLYQLGGNLFTSL